MSLCFPCTYTSFLSPLVFQGGGFKKERDVYVLFPGAELEDGALGMKAPDADIFVVSTLCISFMIDH